jgi:hypothetical protein
MREIANYMEAVMVRLSSVLVSVFLFCFIRATTAEAYYDDKDYSDKGFDAVNPKSGALIIDVDPVKNNGNYGSPPSEEVVSVKQKNSREFTATYSDDRKADLYIDRDGSIKKGIPTGSLP